MVKVCFLKGLLLCDSQVDRYKSCIKGLLICVCYIALTIFSQGPSILDVWWGIGIFRDKNSGLKPIDFNGGMGHYLR